MNPPPPFRRLGRLVGLVLSKNWIFILWNQHEWFVTGRRVHVICRFATALVERPSGAQRVQLGLFTNSRVNGMLEKNIGRRAKTEKSWTNWTDVSGVRLKNSHYLHTWDRPELGNPVCFRISKVWLTFWRWYQTHFFFFFLL